MVKVTTPFKTISGNSAIGNDVVSHETAVGISVNSNSELVVKDKDQNTVALYAYGQWARAVKE